MAQTAKIGAAFEARGTVAMRMAELVFFGWNDAAGLTRGRAFPIAHLDDRLKKGIGWIPVCQSLSVFDVVAPGPWGAMGDMLLMADPETKVRIDFWDDHPPLHFYLCDAVGGNGEKWDSCTRTFLKDALGDFTAATGLEILGGFEQEFHLSDVTPHPGPCFSLDSFRLAADFGAIVVAAVEEAGAEPIMFEAEYAPGQYEINCAPALGLGAADRAVIVREVVREVARRMNRRASFTPIMEPAAVGNGQHVHISFRDAQGQPAIYDPAGPDGVSELAGQFAAGVLRHMPALVAITAPSVISYLRLGPHHWSSGFTCFSANNREAAVRVFPGFRYPGRELGSQYNLEYRAADAAANPHLVLGVLVRAGLQGIKERLAMPPLIDSDPSDLDAAERARLGIQELPTSLGAALDALERDTTVRSWFSDNLWQAYLGLKRFEIEHLRDLSDDEMCRRYYRVY